MRLNEFYNPEEDKYTQQTVSDTRKSKMTLEQLNKLRKYRDIKKKEKEEHAKFVQQMYRAPSEGGDAGGIL